MNSKNPGMGCLLLFLGVAECLAASNPVRGFQVVSNESWAVVGELSVGQQSASNVLHIVSGSSVSSSTGYIGFFHNAHANQVLVDDSVWNNSATLYVGLIGRENLIQITNSGQVYASSAYVGSSPSSHSNRVEVSDGGLLQMDQTLAFGSYSTGNQLIVNQGSIVANMATIGRNQGSAENFVLVNGGSFETHSDLIMGGAGTGNRFEVIDGGAVDVKGGLIVGQDEGGSLNYFTVAGSNSSVSGESIIIGAAGSTNFFNAGDAASVFALNRFTVGELEGSTHNQARFNGEGTTLSAYDLVVGEEGRYNRMYIENGADGKVSGDAFVGFGSNSVGNLLFVDDSNLSVDGDLHVGLDGTYNRMLLRRGGVLETENAFIGSGSGARYNRIQVSSGSSWTNRNHLALSNRSSLIIGSGARVKTGSYSQDGSSTLIYGFDADAGSEGVGLLSVANEAVFEEGALIDFQAPLSQLDIGDAYTLMTAQQIIGGALTNDVSQILPNQLLLDVGVVEEEDQASLQYTRKSLVEVTGLAGTDLEELLHSIDSVASSNHQAEALLQAINRSGCSAEEVADKLGQLYARRVEVVSVVEQARVTAIGQISAHVRTVQENQQRYAKPAPLGPSGPHKAGQGWAPWFKGYGAKGKASRQETFSGYDARTYGGVFGIDRSVGAILGGVAFGYSDSAIDQYDGGESDIATYYGYLYGSAGVRRWYTDFSLGYGRSSVKAVSGAGFGSSSDFNADDYTAYVAIGRQARMQKWLITPQFGLTGSYYIQESFADSGGSVAGTVADEYDRWSLRYSLGAALAYERALGSWILKPEVRAYWLHEFNADPDEIGYRLIGGGGGGTYSLRAPEEDVIELGVGFEFMYADRLKFTFDLDAELGEFYEGFTASGRMGYEF